MKRRVPMHLGSGFELTDIIVGPRRVGLWHVRTLCGLVVPPAFVAVDERGVTCEECARIRAGEKPIRATGRR